MMEARKLLGLTWTAAVILAVALASMFVLVFLIDSGFGEVVFHLSAGFVFFLHDNLGKVSTDSGTWGPGLVAFCLALVIAHRFLHRYAIKRNMSWTFVTTACLGLLLPILFIVAFIVPGALLQVKSLAENPWFKKAGDADVWINRVLNEKHSTRPE